MLQNCLKSWWMLGNIHLALNKWNHLSPGRKSITYSLPKTLKPPAIVKYAARITFRIVVLSIIVIYKDALDLLHIFQVVWRKFYPSVLWDSSHYQQKVNFILAIYGRGFSESVGRNFLRNSFEYWHFVNSRQVVY